MLDVAAEQRDKNQEDLKNNIEGSSRELRDVRGDLQAQALAVRENNSMIQKLSWIVGGDVVAPMKALYDMVAKVWYDLFLRAHCYIHMQGRVGCVLT